MNLPPDGERVSLEEMDRIFGPDWRYPYCRWPRESADSPGSARTGKDRNPRSETDPSLKQLRLEEEAT
ncbi:MAG: hypothetical protein JW820_18675 [Spirochaetales bacterium]|nr:hypothetical protein [Spirochaetales bacterium]